MSEDTSSDRPEKSLTRKQRVFVEAYLKCWNATEAARQAGYKKPNVNGPRSLVHPLVAPIIAERIGAAAMAADEVLARLAEQARVNIADFLVINGNVVRDVVLDADVIRQRGHLIKAIRSTKWGMSIELYDGQNALIQIGKGLGILKDRLDLTTDGEKIIIHTVEAVKPGSDGE